MDLACQSQVGSGRSWATSELAVELVQLQQIRQETAEFAGSFPPNFVEDRIEEEKPLVLPLYVALSVAAVTAPDVPFA